MIKIVQLAGYPKFDVLVYGNLTQNGGQKMGHMTSEEDHMIYVPVADAEGFNGIFKVCSETGAYLLMIT